MPGPLDPKSIALVAGAVPARTKPSNYPEPFARRMAGREKRALGNAFGLTKFGVNLTRLAPGAQSALMHVHSEQEELVYILEGHPSLVTPQATVELAPGMCAGFPANGIAHHLVNRTDRFVVYLEIGDRSSGDRVRYPVDDLQAVLGVDGGWVFSRKDGSLYD
ncbi:MAG: cupin domain-containing protein [Pseudomonadota bacterium]